MRFILASLLCVGLLCGGPIAAAQEHPPQQQLAMPDAEKIVLLLRSTLNTLNDAIQTGNYTVLRDRGAPGFREANSAAKLAHIFDNLAAQNLDLSAINLIAPQLNETPTLDQERAMLHLKGHFPGEPVRIDFEVLYQAVEGHWRLFGLSVRPVSTSAADKLGTAPAPLGQ